MPSANKIAPQTYNTQVSMVQLDMKQLNKKGAECPWNKQEEDDIEWLSYSLFFRLPNLHFSLSSSFADA